MFYGLTSAPTQLVYPRTGASTAAGSSSLPSSKKVEYDEEARLVGVGAVSA